MTTSRVRADVIGAGQDGLITADQCAQIGITPGQIARLVRRGEWRAVFRGVYHTRPGPPDETQLIRAGLLAAGPRAVAVLSSAARIHGWPVLPRDAGVQVSLPADRRRLDQPGLTARQLVLRREDVLRVAGMAVTTPARTAADLLLRMTRAEAVPMLDAALGADLLTEDDLDISHGLIYGNRGAVRARASIAAADRRAQSPLESRIRLICADGGVPPTELQYPVYDNFGALVAVSDLAWSEYRVLGEADGRAPHSTPEALLHDRWRQNTLMGLGFIVVRFSWADVLRPAYVVQTVRNALATARERRDDPHWAAPPAIT